MATGTEYLSTSAGYIPFFAHHSKPTDDDTAFSAESLKILAAVISIVIAGFMIADAEGRHEANSDFPVLDTFADPVCIVGLVMLVISFLYLVCRASEYFEANKPAANKIEMNNK